MIDPLSTAALLELFSGAGISLPENAISKLARHAEEMLAWNRSIRLTAITARREVAVKHILDSLTLLSFAPFPGRTLDFGSGAGYPGIPLAVAVPDAHVILFESSAKKCAFLSRACFLLELRNAEVVRGRLEAGAPLPQGRFEQIVTRATMPARDAVRLLGPCLSAAGRLLLMLGPSGAKGAAGGAGKEQELSHGMREGGRKTFELPFGMGTREIREILATGP